MGLPSGRTAAVAGVLALGATVALPGQSVHGTVTDSATVRPLGACHVSLIDRDQQVAATAITDSAGGFVLRAPGPGSYTVRFERIGYRTVVSQPLALDATSDHELTVPLSAAAVGLPTVTVSAVAGQDARLERAGFYQRKGAEQGFFLDPGDVAKRIPGARQLTDLLRGTPGVGMVQTDRGTSGAGPKMRGMPSLAGPDRPCVFPRVYLDGVLVNIHDPSDWRQAIRDFNEIARPEDVLAIEGYRGPSETPEQYGGWQSRCGVLLIWTKR